MLMWLIGGKFLIWLQWNYTTHQLIENSSIYLVDSLLFISISLAVPSLG